MHHVTDANVKTLLRQKRRKKAALNRAKLVKLGLDQVETQIHVVERYIRLLPRSATLDANDS